MYNIEYITYGTWSSFTETVSYFFDNGYNGKREMRDWLKIEKEGKKREPKYNVIVGKQEGIYRTIDTSNFIETAVATHRHIHTIYIFSF